MTYPFSFRVAERTRGACWRLAWLACIGVSAAPARGSDAPGLLNTTCAADDAHSSQIEWSPSFERYRTSEAVFTGVLLLPIAGALFLYPDPKPNWRGGILFDDAVRNALRLKSRHGRSIANFYSDLPYYVLAAYPLVVDDALVTWGLGGSDDVALQMLGINLEAYALTGAVALSAEKMGRVRPEERGCRADPAYSPDCGDSAALSQSFWSGHTAIAFTSAGLLCAHHQHLQLYGGGAPDVLACGVGLAAASATGVLRVMSDNHYASDVLLGVSLGLFSGYFLPSWLHYGFGSGNANRAGGVLPSFRSAGDAPLIAVLAPAFSEGYAGVTLAGAY